MSYPMPILAALALLTAAQGAHAETTPAGCTNYGTITQVGADNTYSCDTGTRCTNEGVILQAGVGNRYDCEGRCDNQGLVVSANLLGSYCGEDRPGACVGDFCTQRPPPSGLLLGEGSA